MSRWILQSAASDSDPISFERLAQMLAEGKIDETDLLRPEHGDDWQAVDSVIGLCRAAEKLRASIVDTSAGKDHDHNPTTVVRPRTITQITESGPAVLAKPLSWLRVVLLCLGSGCVGWCGWSYWVDSLRFPKPAHIANNPEPLILPWIGAVSGFEILMIAVDTIAVMTFVVWWSRSKRYTR